MSRHRRGVLLLLRDVLRVAGTLLRRYLGPLFAKPVRGRSDDTVLLALHPERVPVRVEAVTQETPTTVSLNLVPVHGLLPPRLAGQYVTLYLRIGGTEASRPYSVSSPPTDPTALTLTVRAKPNGYVSSHILERVRPGDILHVSAPAGEMQHNPLRDTDELVFIAAGSGVTPFAAMVEDLIDRGEPVRMTLLHAVRTAEEQLFAERFAALQARSDRLDVTRVVEQPPHGWQGPAGLLDAALVRDRVGGDVARKTFYVCGSSEFVAHVRRVLAELGVAQHRVRVESYGPPADVTAEAGYPEGIPPNGSGGFRVRLLRTDVDAPARADETLLGSLERAGRAPPSRCRSNACDVCRLRLTAGEVFVPRRGRLFAGTEGVFVRTCACYPLSDVTLEA